MMKKIAFLLFFTGFLSNAQDLYVGPSSFVYALDDFVFVNNDIQLEAADSHFYLRGDAQLLQNNDIKNSDLGSLSVYQESTTGVYEYNYWCSPVGVGTDGTQGNVGFVADDNILDPDDEADLTNVLSNNYPFTAGVDATVVELSSYWIFKLIEAEGYNGWVHIGETNAVLPGQGYTMKGYPSPPPPAPPIQNTLDFRGRPNNGTFTVGLNYDGTDDEPLSEPINAVSTLMGNPYPSAFDMKLFMNTNIAITDGNAYFWDQEAVGTHVLTAYQGGYATYTPGAPGVPADNGTYSPAVFTFYDGFGGPGGGAGGTPTDFSANNERRYAAIGQGFVLNSSGAGGNVVFNNSMRLYLPEDSSESGNGSVFRTTDTPDHVLAMSHNGIDYNELINNPMHIPDVRIHAHINGTYYRENVIASRPNTDLSYNKYTDGFMYSSLEDDVFLMADELPVVIKSIEVDEFTRIPLMIKSSTNASTFEITVNSINHFDSDIDVYLYDDLYQTYTDIKEGTFNVTLSEGDYSDRFEITFSNQETLSDYENLIDALTIFQDNVKHQFTILNPANLNIISLQLYDMAGKLILNHTKVNNPSNYYVSTSNISDGVYLATLQIDEIGPVSKKVIVKN
ncbi:MAG: T9SS type A sorting domain-containing protein [Flavobacteriaceae bacterium]|nr:T9SS type A sorting domain-containing protein [Flavobacteriaceae bacterium]